MSTTTITMRIPSNSLEVKSNNRNCWFCERKCTDYVSICEICKDERFRFKKNKTLHHTDRAKTWAIDPTCV
jgi:hypothetical protein